MASVAYAGIEAAADALEDVSDGRPLLDAVEVVLRLQLTTAGLSRMREVLALARAQSLRLAACKTLARTGFSCLVRNLASFRRERSTRSILVYILLL